MAAAGCSPGSGGTSDAVPKEPERTAGTPYAPYVSATTADCSGVTQKPGAFGQAFGG